MRHGDGVIEWFDDVVYQGTFENGKIKEGQIFFGSKSITYDGQYDPVTSAFNGRGTLQYKTGFQKGFFKEGFLEGYGEIHNAQGDVQKGNYRKGKLHGDGCELK